MADVNLRDADVLARSAALTDVVLAFDPTVADAADAAKTDLLSERIAFFFQNPPASLTTTQSAALRTLLAVLTQTEVDARAVARYADAEKTKLAGIAAGANLLIPYKIGNIYRAFADGDAVTKPTNTEGTVTVAGITVAPAGWQLTRPEATAALPNIYDCHVYGYSTNGVFSWQFGTPNRTDRYIDLSALAPLASPALTGVPTLPTATPGTNTTQAASTAFVVAQIAAAMLTGGADGVLGSVDVSGTTLTFNLSTGTSFDVDLMSLVTGLISAVTAGVGLTGGGTAGDVSLDLDLSGIQTQASASASDLFAFWDASHLRMRTLTFTVFRNLVTANLSAELITLGILDDARLSSAIARLASPALTGAPTAPTPAETDADERIATKGYVDALVAGMTPTPTHTSYVASSADAVFTAAEFMAGASGQGNSLAVPVYTGSRFVAFARPVSAGTITELYFHAQGAGRGNNQIGAWTVLGDVLDIGGEDHYVVHSDGPLNAIAGVVFVVEVA